ncbi:inositol monophosphatase family protein [Desulfococcaceae bacterium HSG9]|nr:inositol monophosphatase family protein [Desulfococcaceae bacterium HSG9]
MDLIEIQKIGISAAYEAAEILLSYFGKISEYDKKGATDLVTRADIESEKAIIQTIRKHFPDHTIIAEESGLNQGIPRYQWIVDPLDGTTNFAHHLALCCISIAFAIEDRIVVGIIFNPMTDELFTATDGNGAFLNERPISVSETQTVSESLLVTGFPYHFKDIFDSIMARFENCLNAAQGVRRLGSAALDLCYVACGRFDAFWEQKLNPWDTAAGYLIAKEAGASVTDFSNTPFTLDKKEILATNGQIHQEMLELMKIKIKDNKSK